VTIKEARVGTSSSSEQTSTVGDAGETQERPTPLQFVPDPPRRRVTREMVRELEDAGLVDTAKVAERLAS